MPAEERHDKSLIICAALMRSMDWSEVRNVHCFEPIARLGEVDLSSFVSDLQGSRPNIKIYTSRKIDGGWRVVSVDSGEPAGPVPRFDAVIVPMLGFDGGLHRVGYGVGYYDQLLAAQPGARKIGVCFEQGRVERLPREPHDVALDLIVTEKNIYK